MQVESRHGATAASGGSTGKEAVQKIRSPKAQNYDRRHQTIRDPLRAKCSDSQSSGVYVIREHD